MTEKNGSTPTPAPGRKPVEPWNMGLFVAIGLSVGTALGVALDNLGLWLPIGVALGITVGVALGAANRQGRDTTDAADPSEAGDTPDAATPGAATRDAPTRDADGAPGTGRADD